MSSNRCVHMTSDLSEWLRSSTRIRWLRRGKIGDGHSPPQSRSLSTAVLVSNVLARIGSNPVVADFCLGTARRRRRFAGATSSQQVVSALGDGFVVPVVRDVLGKMLEVIV